MSGVKTTSEFGRKVGFTIVLIIFIVAMAVVTSSVAWVFINGTSMETESDSTAQAQSELGLVPTPFSTLTLQERAAYKWAHDTFEVQTFGVNAEKQQHQRFKYVMLLNHPPQNCGKGSDPIGLRTSDDGSLWAKRFVCVGYSDWTKSHVILGSDSFYSWSEWCEYNLASLKRRWVK